MVNSHLQRESAQLYRDFLKAAASMRRQIFKVSTKALRQDVEKMDEIYEVYSDLVVWASAPTYTTW